MAAGILVTAASLGVFLIGTRSGSEPGILRLPDGTRFEIPAMPYDRPVTRQAAGMDRQWEEAGAAYQSGNYLQSERIFGQIERVERRDPERHDATLYRGISLLMAGRHEEAEVALRQSRDLADETGLSNTTDSFYLGVAALARNDRREAAEALRQAVGGPFDAEARELLAGLAGT